MSRFFSLVLLLLTCLLARSRGLVLPGTSTFREQKAFTSSPTWLLSNPVLTKPPSSKRTAPSPLFSVAKSDDNTTPRKRNTFQHFLLLKLSAFLMAATLFVSAPAHAADNNGYFTPEMETSVATLVEGSKDRVSFWYPEMDEKGQEEQAEQSSTPSSKKGSATKATIHKNRGGASQAYESHHTNDTPTKTKRFLPLLLLNSFLVVAAALFGREETAESLRRRFSRVVSEDLSNACEEEEQSSKIEGRKSLSEFVDYFLHSNFCKMIRHDWKVAMSTLARTARAASAGLGMGLEEAAQLLQNGHSEEKEEEEYTNDQEGSAVYNFDYDVVESLLWQEPYDGSTAAAAVRIPMADIHQLQREEDVHAMIQDLRKAEKYVHARIQELQEKVKQSKFGLRRCSPKERKSRPPVGPTTPPSSTNNHAPKSVMLQRSPRMRRNRPGFN